MARYKVLEDVKVETNHPLHGRVAASFKKGEVRPKNEEQEVALELLVKQEFAERIKEPARKSAKSKKSEPARTELAADPPAAEE